MAEPANINERIIARIDAAKPRLHGEDDRVLTFIRDALQPERLAARPEEDSGVGHLHDVAKQRLRRYERERNE